ncbi:hypothetical protein M409DRAFT_63321 [Zasmidium cellare ATCC 36951]|uniref:SH3 domain-containing protein n=1 Tax=Zasmidium cellare ATCC 36951 TaxID=1080233 RepID=A0A6A6CZX0_ZASCE|nr:uncharacterized protein M409DRAFT_63321 [Zasmidium cellare ATCC 36951]KAF2171708.1 hypothetical protein M409DRAFT_63321 [Zasmidium cellare ATCC 36951]
MKSVHRLGGKMMKRSADQQDVGAVIASFKATDEMLDRMIKDLKTWRNGWDDILKLQYDASEAFANLYKPIEPATYPEQRRKPAETPQQYMQKCLALQKMYSDMKQDLQQEISMIDNKLIRPVDEAKRATKALQKTLKHRENMKLDYERYLSRAEHARKKAAKSPKDEAALEKHESDLTQAQIDYQTADDQVKQTFPPVTDAVCSLLPYLLAIQVQVQTTLVGQIYTSLDAYCKKHGMPSPAPSDAEIISRWDGEFTGLRKELEEGITLLAGGKAKNQAMNVPDKDGSTLTGLGLRNKAGLHSTHTSDKDGSTMTGLGIRNKTMGLAHRAKGDSSPRPPTNGSTYGGGSTHHYQEDDELAPPKPPRPSTGSPTLSPGISMTNNPRMPSYSNNNYDQKPTNFMPSMPSQNPPPYTESVNSTPPSHYRTPVNGNSPDPSHAAGNDYFDNKNPRPSASRASSAASIAAAAKKKPPPPVPVKRIPSQQGQFVTALYDFDGQNDGDLSFREGDKIRVVKRTESTDDWWEGELRGRMGSFPANYVQV